MRPEDHERWRPTFSRIGEPWWGDKPIIVVGAGPSLKGFDFERLRGLGYVLAVKSAWRDIAFADACCGLDYPWMRREIADLAQLATRMPLYLCVEDTEFILDAREHPLPVPGAIYIKRDRATNDLSERDDQVSHGGNSGFAAFNVAFLKKVLAPSCIERTIVLLGFDYNRDGGHYAPDRYTHNPAGHNARYLPRWAANFQATAAQIAYARINVLNASPHSTVDAFSRCTIDEALEHLRHQR